VRGGGSWEELRRVVKQKVLVLFMVAALVIALLPPVSAEAQGNYVPMDPSTLPQVPGCSWNPSAQYPGTFESWCGSDEIGWYRPYEWHLLTGYYPPDHGLGGG
jgi:hypothetical protein